MVPINRQDTVLAKCLLLIFNMFTKMTELINVKL